MVHNKLMNADGSEREKKSR